MLRDTPSASHVTAHVSCTVSPSPLIPTDSRHLSRQITSDLGGSYASLHRGLRQPALLLALIEVTEDNGAGSGAQRAAASALVAFCEARLSFGPIPTEALRSEYVTVSKALCFTRRRFASLPPEIFLRTMSEYPNLSAWPSRKFLEHWEITRIRRVRLREPPKVSG